MTQFSFEWILSLNWLCQKWGQVQGVRFGLDAVIPMIPPEVVALNLFDNMSLSIGDKLGPHEILAPIGKGGMGEVYRARDTRLNRDVAIKVSAERFNERFEREARAIAALNHPNICHLYDVGPNYLVMELVDGPTLADRIRESAIPLEEALPIASQIAQGLEAAHEKGVTHRDLKPGNVKVKSDGVVKVPNEPAPPSRPNYWSRSLRSTAR